MNISKMSIKEIVKCNSLNKNELYKSLSEFFNMSITRLEFYIGKEPVIDPIDWDDFTDKIKKSLITMYIIFSNSDKSLRKEYLISDMDFSLEKTIK